METPPLCDYHAAACFGGPRAQLQSLDVAVANPGCQRSWRPGSLRVADAGGPDNGFEAVGIHVVDPRLHDAEAARRIGPTQHASFNPTLLPAVRERIGELRLFDRLFRREGGAKHRTRRTQRLARA